MQPERCRAAFMRSLRSSAASSHLESRHSASRFGLVQRVLAFVCLFGSVESYLSCRSGLGAALQTSCPLSVHVLEQIDFQLQKFSFSRAGMHRSAGRHTEEIQPSDVCYFTPQRRHGPNQIQIQVDVDAGVARLSI